MAPIYRKLESGEWVVRNQQLSRKDQLKQARLGIQLIIRRYAPNQASYCNPKCPEPGHKREMNLWSRAALSAE